MNEVLYKALKAWLETATRNPHPLAPEANYTNTGAEECAVADAGLCNWCGMKGVSGLKPLLHAQFGDSDWPFDHDDPEEYGANRGRHHLNPRRVAWVKQQIADWEGINNG